MSPRGMLDVGQQPLVERRRRSRARARSTSKRPTTVCARRSSTWTISPFGAAVVAVALDAHDDAIAVQRLLEVRGRDVDVALHALGRPLRRHEAEAGRMALEPADDEIHAIGQPVAIAADEHERAVVDERFQVPLERRVLVAGNLEHAHQFARGGRMRHRRGSAAGAGRGGHWGKYRRHSGSVIGHGSGGCGSGNDP